VRRRRALSEESKVVEVIDAKPPAKKRKAKARLALAKKKNVPKPPPADDEEPPPRDDEDFSLGPWIQLAKFDIFEGKPWVKQYIYIPLSGREFKKSGVRVVNQSFPLSMSKIPASVGPEDAYPDPFQFTGLDNLAEAASQVAPAARDPDLDRPFYRSRNTIRKRREEARYPYKERLLCIHGACKFAFEAGAQGLSYCLECGIGGREC
jgi:hypothetical protein